jgi:hypothetical protein
MCTLDTDVASAVLKCSLRLDSSCFEPRRHSPFREFLIEPSRNGGTTGDAKGFEPLPDRAIALDARASADDLGKAVRMALDATT